MRFSAHRLNMYMTCALQAHFHYTIRLPEKQNAKASFGVIIHHALEYYNKTGNIDNSIKIFEDNWANPEKLGVIPEVWPKMTSYAGLLNRGVEILQSYHDTLKWGNRKVIATEHKFLVPFGRHELQGIVDLVELTKSGKGKTLLRIVDYKTKTKKPFLPELLLDIQMTVYYYASLQREFWVGNGPEFPGLPDGENLFNKMIDVPRRPIWYHLWTNQALDAGPRHDDDFMRLYRVANEIEKAINADVHIPKIGEACGWCSYKDPCGVAIPQLDDDEAWL